MVGEYKPTLSQAAETINTINRENARMHSRIYGLVDARAQVILLEGIYERLGEIIKGQST